MARMFNPPHPGLTLRDDVLPALGLTVTQAAQQLGVSRVTLSRMLNGRAAVSPEMALRIEAWLGVARGGEARLWLAEQSAYDMWQATQKFKAAPMRVQRAPLARLTEEGLQLRLRAEAAAAPRRKLRLPVHRGRGGLVAGVDPLSNKALLKALGDDA